MARTTERSDALLTEAEALMPLPNGPRTGGMLKRWEGILRDRRERLDRLALGTLAERWQQWQPLLEAHVAADSRALKGAPADSVDTPLAHSPQALDAHRLRMARAPSCPPVRAGGCTAGQRRLFSPAGRSGGPPQ